jgi:hypothetical protein
MIDNQLMARLICTLSAMLLGQKYWHIRCEGSSYGSNIFKRMTGLALIFLELQRGIWHSMDTTTSQADPPDSAAGTMPPLVGNQAEVSDQDDVFSTDDQSGLL